MPTALTRAVSRSLARRKIDICLAIRLPHQIKKDRE
jgi:hypothetical protein